MCSFTFLPSKFFYDLGKLFLEKTPLILGSQLRYLVILILLKGCSGTKTFLFAYPLLALLTPLTLIAFTTEDVTGCTIEAAIGSNKGPRNLRSCFFISCFTVSVTLSINPCESNLVMVL